MMACAYHDDPALKQLVLYEMREYRTRGQLINRMCEQFNNGRWKGSAVECTIHTLNHKYGKQLDYADYLGCAKSVGIPEALIRLQELIFEKLETDASRTWPEHFLNAISIGSDLDMVWPQFVLWMLRDAELLYITDENREVINDVIALYKEWCDTDVKPTIDRWRAAADAATAAWRAIGPDPDVIEANDTWRAADAAEAAWRAASDRATADSTAFAAAESADCEAWEKMAEKLVDLITKAPR